GRRRPRRIAAKPVRGAPRPIGADEPAPAVVPQAKARADPARAARIGPREDGKPPAGGIVGPPVRVVAQAHTSRDGVAAGRESGLLERDDAAAGIELDPGAALTAGRHARLRHLERNAGPLVVEVAVPASLDRIGRRARRPRDARLDREDPPRVVAPEAQPIRALQLAPVVP